MKFNSPEFVSKEYYNSEIKNFQAAKNFIFKKFYIAELNKNKLIGFIIILVLFLLIMLTFNMLTFGDFNSFFFVYNINKINFYALLNLCCFKFLYFLTLAVVYCLTSSDCEFTNTNLLGSSYASFQYIIKYLIFPFVLYIAYSKLNFFIFIYADDISAEEYNNRQLSFVIKNIFSDIKNVVFKDKGLAIVYLFRLYNLQISVISILILFYFSNGYVFIFSDKSIRAFLLYSEATSAGTATNQINNSVSINNGSDGAIIYIQILTIALSYLFSQLIYYLNYPVYNNTRQIFDSIFSLNEHKIASNFAGASTKSINNTMTILESKFTYDFVNFDIQSESFYKSSNYDKIKYFKYLNEVYYIYLIYSNAQLI